jgi:CubicO group peptidase (beta-lactamase class C family)
MGIIFSAAEPVYRCIGGRVMKKYFLYLFIGSLIVLNSCQEDPTEEPTENNTEEQPQEEPRTPDNTNPDDSLDFDVTTYYPPINQNQWSTVSPDSLGWNINALNEVLQFVKTKNTYGFIILHNGRIVTENYWNDWNAGTRYYIASAGKSVTAFLVGLAQQEGILNLKNKTSDYLGEGWTSLPVAKENLITIHHHLSMTTGLDETDDHCSSRSCLAYKTDAGKRWAYHNAPYILLNQVIEIASNTSIDLFTKTRLADKIGMRSWEWKDNMLWLSTRDMARFGLLILSDGSWNNSKIMTDSTYLKSMVETSNPFNKSYGYLWWLNGKESYKIPLEDKVLQGSLVPSAPADMISAMGKGDKKIYIIPSLDLVVVRHGDDTGENTFGPSSFDNELWKKLKEVIQYND